MKITRMNRTKISFLSVLYLAAYFLASSLADEHQQPSRRLALGDFAELNALVYNAEIRLPDASLSSNGVDLDIYSVKCSKIQVGDVIVSSRKTSLSRVEVTLELRQLDMVCQARYKYSGRLFGGRGDVELYSYSNEATTLTFVSSPNYNTVAPNTLQVQNCNPKVNVQDMDFKGGILGFVLNRVERLLRNYLERFAEERICTELNAFMERGEGFLQFAKETLDLYDPSKLVLDPLLSERLMQVPINTNLLNLQEKDTSFGRWVHMALEEGVKYMNAQVAIDENDNGGRTDMQANILLRKYFLNRDGSLTIDLSTLPNGGMIYQGHDILTETTITVNTIKLLGLDTLTKFDPLKDVGLRTLQNDVSWDYLSFEANVEITIKPSTLPNSVIVNPNSVPTVVERAKINFGIDKLDAVASFLMAVDQDKLEALTFGSLLEKENILNCLFSTVFQMELSTLAVEAIDIQPPTLNGFVSRGIDRVVSEAVDTSFLMYERLLLQSAPAFFQNNIRDLLNEGFREFLTSGFTCTASEFDNDQEDGVMAGDGLVDLRDLLLPPDVARLAGGTGLEPYGNVISTVILPNIKGQLLEVDMFNSRVVRPFTQKQSGEEGTLTYSPSIVDFTLPSGEDESDSAAATLLWDKFELKASDVRIRNLDTVIDPLMLVEPTDWDSLFNRITIGSDNASKHLNLTMRILMDVQGDDSPLKMRNEIDVSMSIPKSTLSFDIIASLKERALMDIPLDDFSNLNCWLALLETPGVIQEDVLDQQRKVAQSLAFQGFVVTLSSFSLDAQCVSCSSPVGILLPEFLQEFQQNALLSHLFSPRFAKLFEELLWGYWKAFDVGILLEDAPRHCPSHPEYDEDATPVELTWPNAPDLSMTAVETLVAFCVLALHLSTIVVAENHLLNPLPSDAQRYTQETPPLQPEFRTLDWTDLSASLGGWADFAFGELREYLEEIVTDSSINDLLRTSVLGEDGVKELQFDSTRFEAAGFNISLSQLRVYGLDSISSMNALIAADVQTLENHILWDKLDLMVDIDIEMAGSTSRRMSLAYSLQNVEAQIDLMLAMNLDRLGDIELGSILDIQKIFPCLVSGISDFKISKLLVSAGSIEAPTIEGFLSRDVRVSVLWIFESIFQRYRSDLLASLPLVSDSTVRGIVNAMLPQLLESIAAQCTPPPEMQEQGYVDFRDLFLPQLSSRAFGGSGTSPYGDLFRTLFQMLYEKVLNTYSTNGEAINDLIAKWTKDQSNVTGAFMVVEEALDTNGSFTLAGLTANMALKLSNVSVHNLNSLGRPLELLQPVSSAANLLNNTFSMGSGGNPLRFAARLLLSLSDDAEMQIRNELDININLDRVAVFASVLLKISVAAFVSFPIRDLPNVKCWLATILSEYGDAASSFRGVGLANHTISIDNATLDIECVSCTSPSFDDLLYELYSQDSEEASEVLKETADRVINGDFLQVFLDQVVADSAKQCPHRIEYDPKATTAEFLKNPGKSLGFEEQLERDTKAVYFNVANSVIAGCLLIIGVVGKWITRRRNRKWVASLQGEGRYLLEWQQEKERAREERLNRTTTSLFQSPFITKKIRLAVPIYLLVNTGLYMGAHLGVLSTVDVDASLAGEAFTIHNFLTFSFIESTKRTYYNGGSEMAVLMWIFTGIWPYVKIIISLLLWMLPPTKLSVSRRGRILLWLDALARLSIIDVFTMVLGVAIILVYAGGPSDDVLGADDALYLMKVIVVPGFGFYCIIIAQRMSRVSSRFFLDYHQRVIDMATFEHENAQHSMGVSSFNYTDDEQDVVSLVRQDVQGDDPSEAHRDSSPERTPEEFKDEEASSDEEEQSRFDAVSVDPDDGWNHGDGQDLGGQKTALSAENQQWGTAGVICGGVTIGIIFIVGCFFAPSVSLDTSDVWGLALESGKTFEETISEYGVFAIAGMVLVKARFVLEKKSDYVGFGLLLVVGILSVGMTFLIRAYQFIIRKLKERKLGSSSDAPNKISGSDLPSYMRLHKWKHMEIYLISFAIGVWQLGSLSMYAIHVYCDLLGRLYRVLSYVGLVESSNAECFRIQAKYPGNLLIICSAFMILLAAFMAQATGQYRKNVSDAIQSIGKKDVSRMSMIWHPGKSSSRLSAPLSNLNETASLSHDNSFDSEHITPPSFTSTSSDGRCGPSHDEDGPTTPFLEAAMTRTRSISSSRQRLSITGEAGSSTGLLEDSTKSADGTERRMLPTTRSSSRNNQRRPSYGEVGPTTPLVEGLSSPSSAPSFLPNELTPIYYDSDDSSLPSSYQDSSLPPRNMLFQGSALSMPPQREMIPSSSSITGETGPSTGPLQGSTKPAAETERRILPTTRSSSRSTQRRPSYGEVGPTTPLVVEGLSSPSSESSFLQNELTPIYYDSDDSSLPSSQQDSSMPPRNMLFQGSALSMPPQRGMIPTSSSMRGEPTLGEDLPDDE